MSKTIADDELSLPLLNEHAQVFGFHFVQQSGLEPGSMMSMNVGAQSENVKFSDAREDYTLDLSGESDPTRWGQDSYDADLQNFFSRPIKIAESQWGTGTSLFNSFNPWTLYFENPRVANRIANFQLLRAKLHIKIVVNGNGFQYGRAIASYLPLALFDSLSQNIALIPETLVQASQQPHIFLDPTLSRGGEMILPFFYYKNSLNITSSDWRDMGALTIRSINTLKHANGAADTASVSVFCWAEDVYLNVLTSVESTSLVPQAGSEIEQANSKGFISGPATALAGAANVLSNVPIIAPYARATETAASGVAGAAKILGFSRPNQTVAPTPLLPTLTSSMATTTVPDRSDKLTVDDMQELTIDSRIAGISPEDPFNIKSIATRESYLTSFAWNIGTSPETLLWNCRVSPMLWAQSASAYHFPACAVASYPFRYWTGSMNFRFQFVASSFHKGRVKIVFDPNFLASNEYNVNYLEVIDIADKSDFTINVKNGQEYTLLDRSNPGSDSVTTLYSTTTYASKEPGNGVIGVYVVNSLTTPNSTVNNNITCNVYVSAGEDFEVYAPVDGFQRFVFRPQSGVEVADAENTQEKDAPAHTQSTSMGNRDDSLVNVSHVYTGESIKSFRPLLKRYSLHHIFGPGNTVNTLLYHRMAMYPYLRGNVAGAIQASTVPVGPYSYCNTLLFHWVSYCYSGMRGSMRYKFLTDGSLSATIQTTISSNRTPQRGYDLLNVAAPVATTTAGIARNAVWSLPGSADSAARKYGGHQGVTWRNASINSTMDVEMPYYNRDRFVPGKVQNWTTASVANRREVESLETRCYFQGGTNTFFNVFVSIGEDFQCYFFTGLPPMYFEALAPI